MEVLSDAGVINETKIPPELRNSEQWIGWGFEDRDGKKTKVPKDPKTGQNARVDAPETWADFSVAFDGYNANQHGGIGFVFTENDSYCGVDLDGCRDVETGDIESWATDIIQQLDSYTEISPSGTGVHIIARAKKPEGRCRKDRFEIYDSGRWFTITGNLCDDAHLLIRDRQSEVEEIYKEFFGDSEKPSSTKYVVSTDSHIPDDMIIQKAQDARNGGKFRRLMEGNCDGYLSESEADLALVGILSFWTQDPTQILRIVKGSGLWDEKWTRPDYQELTINAALSEGREHYNWGNAAVNIDNSVQSAADTQDLITADAALEFPLEEYMPPSGFLRDYVKYMSPTTEAPPQYHLFSGLVMLATAVGDRIEFVTAGSRKSCNLWVVHVGPSGCKKSTCIDGSMQMLADWGFKESIFPTQITPERLIPMLTKQSTGTFFLSEFGATFDQWGKSYAQDMISIFTSLYDGGYFARWLKDAKYEIERSCISISAGCTPTWLKEKLKKTDISTGFWPRFLLVPSTKRSKYLPMPPEGDPLLKDTLEHRIMAIQAKFAESEPQKINYEAVLDTYNEWYIKNNKAADNDIADPYAANFVVRLSDYVKKLAALIEISSSQTVDIQPATMAYAIKLADWLRNATTQVVATVTQDPMSEVEKRVFDVIARAGSSGLLHTDLRHTVANYNKTQVANAVDSLYDSGDIDKISTKRDGPGRPGTKYVATKSRTNVKSTERI